MTLSELYERLEADPRGAGFSEDIQAVHDAIFGHSLDRSAIAKEVNAWLAKFQPCLFGKVAAKQNLLRFCVLTETELIRSDEYIRDFIQESRSDWLADGYDGNASGFILLAVSERLALARPNAVLRDLALKLCSLHLFENAPSSVDTVCMDSIYLEKPGRARRTWKWAVGINFFGSQGDQRWWHDHRLPGGVALSMNSVGHMAKAGAIHKTMRALDGAISADAEDWNDAHVTSLEKALVLAMRTIRVASEGIKPGTRLFDLQERSPELKCPFGLPPDVAPYNYCEYLGQYHTDHTIPSVYFVDNIDRPPDAMSYKDLDFTYLFDRSLDDFRVMGEGLRVRHEADRDEDTRGAKRDLAAAVEVSVDDEPILRAALKRRGR